MIRCRNRSNLKVDPSKDSGSKVSAEEFGSHFGKLGRGKNRKIFGGGGEKIKLNIKVDRRNRQRSIKY